MRPLRIQDAILGLFVVCAVGVVDSILSLDPRLSKNLRLRILRHATNSLGRANEDKKSGEKAQVKSTLSAKSDFIELQSDGGRFLPVNHNFWIQQ